MKLSIIIPTLNEKDNLPRLLDSIRKQSFEDHEIIVADAGSKDGTVKIAKRYGCRVVKGGMPAQGRNNGAKHSKGEILLFLDSDVLLPDKSFLHNSIKDFQNKRLGIMANSYKPISRKNVDKLLHSFVNHFLGSIQYLKPMGGGMCIFVKKEISDEVGGFNEELLIGEDHEFVERCSKISKFLFNKKIPILVSVRRFNTDGRFNVSFKYTAHTLYRLVTGKEVKKNNRIKLFDYHFDHKKNNRILYAVCGEGMGHAIRTVPIVKHLLKENKEIMIVASGRAYEYLSKKFSNVHDIEGFNIVYEDNMVNNKKTFINAVKKLPIGLNHNLRILYTLIKKFRPNIVISDFEMFSNLIAKIMHIPLLSIDNQHIMTKCRIKVPKKHWKDWMASVSVIRSFIFRPKRYLITTFFYPPVKNKKRVLLFPPILRDEILSAKPKIGDHILVYQTSNSYQKMIDVLKSFNKQKFVIYGHNKEKKDKNLVFRKFNEKTFLREFATCKAVITNGGFTLIGEALHLGKPILSVPVKKQFEQILNAYYLKRLGYGVFYEKLDEDIIEGFLSKLQDYRSNIKKRYKKNDNSLIFKELDILIKKYVK